MPEIQVAICSAGAGVGGKKSTVSRTRRRVVFIPWEISIAFARATDIIVAILGEAVTEVEFLDQPPESDVLTDYDREHMKLYLRLFDAAAEGADWQEVVVVLFGLDPKKEPDRAKRVHDSHLARARWMSEHGYRQLVRDGRG